MSSLNFQVNTLLNDCITRDVDNIQINIQVDKQSLKVKDIQVVETVNGKKTKQKPSLKDAPPLKYIKYTVDDVSRLNHDNHGDCCICMNPFTNSKRTLHSCQHSFCESCLVTWLEYNVNCPLCKKEVIHAKFVKDLK